MFQAFEAEPDRDWAGEYRRSPYYQMYIAAGMDAAPARRPRPVRAGARPPKRANWFAQLGTLFRRYLAVIASDRVFLAVLAVHAGLSWAWSSG